MRAACTHCLVPFDVRELRAGLCHDCLDTVGSALSDDEFDVLESEAVARARQVYGLNAVARPCDGYLRGWSCCAERHKDKAAPAPVRRNDWRRRAYTGTFAEQDAADLEEYFRAVLPAAAWDHSSFGAMCQRIGEATNPSAVVFTTCDEHDASPRTRGTSSWAKWLHAVRRCEACRETERPIDSEKPTRDPQHTFAHVTPCVLESDQVDVRSLGGATKFGSWEDTMAGYLDSRNRLRGTYRVLARIPRWAFDALEARYSESQEQGAGHKKLGVLAGVALLTDTAQAIRDDAARRGETEAYTVESDERGEDGKAKTETHRVSPTLRGTLTELTRKSNSSTVSAQDRAGAGGALTRIQREAAHLLRDAEGEYARRALRMQEG